MAYYPIIKVVAGDDKPDINLTIKDRNTAASGLTLDPNDSDTWKAIDLTNATVKVKFRALGGTTVLDTLNCIKVAPYTDGVCFMIWNTGTLDIAAGTYEGEIYLTYTDGRVQTLYDRLKFKVRDDF